jgi:hypothetical protein
MAVQTRKMKKEEEDNTSQDTFLTDDLDISGVADLGRGGGRIAENGGGGGGGRDEIVVQVEVEEREGEGGGGAGIIGRGGGEVIGRGLDLKLKMKNIESKTN